MLVLGVPGPEGPISACSGVTPCLVWHARLPAHLSELHYMQLSWPRGFAAVSSHRPIRQWEQRLGMPLSHKIYHKHSQAREEPLILRPAQKIYLINSLNFNIPVYLANKRRWWGMNLQVGRETLP